MNVEIQVESKVQELGIITEAVLGWNRDAGAVALTIGIQLLSGGTFLTLDADTFLKIMEDHEVTDARYLVGHPCRVLIARPDRSVTFVDLVRKGW